MKRGYICDTCGEFSESDGPYLDNLTEAKPWSCPVCGKEACSHCYWKYAAHKACCEGKKDAELIALAIEKGFNHFEPEPDEPDICSSCLHKDCTCSGDKKTDVGCVAYI